MTVLPRPLVQRTSGWSFPRPETLSLDNGLEVMLFHIPGQHVISVGLLLDIPLAAEPRQREGVAGLCVYALDEGTRSHPGPTFAEAIEDCGAELDGGVHYAGTHLYLNVPAGQLETGLSLLAEAVREPELTDASIDRLRTLRLAQIDQQLATSAERADHAWRRTLIQRKYRASRMKGGQRDTVQRITPQEVRDFHRRFYGPLGSTLVISGDFNAAVHNYVKDAFEAWHNPHQHQVTHQVAQPRKRQLYLIDRPGSVQADVRVGQWTIDRTHSQWTDFHVAGHVLGGAFLSRLNRILREERGFTYGVNLSHTPMRAGGWSTVRGSFRTEVVPDALTAIPQLLNVSQTPFTDAEVEASCNYLSGIQPLQFQTASGITHGVMGLVSAALPLDFVDTQRTRYEHVTADNATRAATTLLAPDRLSVVVVGDADKLTGPLHQAGWPVRTVPVGDWI